MHKVQKEMEGKTHGCYHSKAFNLVHVGFPGQEPDEDG